MGRPRKGAPRYMHKQIVDIVYTVGVTDPVSGRLELIPNDGSRSIAVTYKELKNKYKRI